MGTKTNSRRAFWVGFGIFMAFGGTALAAESRVCATANEWASLKPLAPGSFVLACPRGRTVSRIDFASYGLPSGSCGAFRVAKSCDSAVSRSRVESACLGKTQCSVSNFNVVFGDPCSGVRKRLFVQAFCSSSAPVVVPSPTASPSASPVVLPTAVPSVKPTPAPSPSPSPAPVPVASIGASTPLAFAAIPYSDPDLVSPGRGMEVWNYLDQAIDYPVTGQGFQTEDVYFRFRWTDFENATQGSYSWSKFDGLINAAISRGQKFSFGIMSIAAETLSYPAYVHDGMQAEVVKDWRKSGPWIPNFNSEIYLSRLEALHAAIVEHLATSSYQGVRYRDAIGTIDVRGFGAWGEWHMGGLLSDVSEYPAGTRPTTETLERIIDAHVRPFQDYQLQIMLSTFDGNRLNHTKTAPEVAYYALTRETKRGKLGWRRDNWSATDSYIKLYTVNNNLTVNGMNLATEIMNRWKFAPVNGEPMNGSTNVGGNCHYWDFPAQVKLYHAASFGNGNYVGLAATDCARTNVLEAAKAAGYRIVLAGGAMSSTIGADRILSVRLDWQNVGTAPAYEDWETFFELRDRTGATVWNGKSAHVMRLFLPAAASTSVTDGFVLPGGIAAGTYSLRLVVRDPAGFRKPLPLAISGRANDGSYPLGAVDVR